jgi:hypothetical protein
MLGTSWIIYLLVVFEANVFFSFSFGAMEVEQMLPNILHKHYGT